MIVEAALAIAGPGAHLVARPTGVVHVYAGPLTPSGRFVPRAGRTVCRIRIRSRQLHVLPSNERPQSLGRAAVLVRLCMRCTACLGRDRDRSRQATRLCSRHEALRAYAGTSKADVAFALQLAATPGEVDAAAWLSLLLFDVAGCNDPFTERGRTWPSLHQLVCGARSRVRGFPEQTYDQAARYATRSAAVRDQRRREAKAAHEEDAALVDRIGINNARPLPPRRPPRR